MKYQCVGGHSFRLTDFPSNEDFTVYNDAELDRIVERILTAYEANQASREQFAGAIEEIFFSSNGQRIKALECPICHRLMMTVDYNLQFSYSRNDPEQSLPIGKSSSLRDLFENLALTRENGEGGQG